MQWSRLDGVQLAYLDEADGANGAFYITAVVLPDHQSIAMGDALQLVVTRAAQTYGGVNPEAELHAVELIGGKRTWQRYRDLIPVRYTIFEAAIDEIVRFDARVYIRGASRKVFSERYSAGTDIHQTVLPWVLERVQADAVERSDIALAIADDHQYRERYRKAMRDFQQFGTFGWRHQRLDRLADTLHFAPSSASRLLQAADLVSYAHIQTLRQHKHEVARAFWLRVWGKLQQGVLKEASTWSGPLN